jgi:hypothetical protein
MKNGIFTIPCAITIFGIIMSHQVIKTLDNHQIASLFCSLHCMLGSKVVRQQCYSAIGEHTTAAS